MATGDLIQGFQYPAIFLGSLLNGPAAMITAGFLVKAGNLSPVTAFLALLLGDLTADFAYYGIGYFGLDRLILRYGHFLDITNEALEKAKEMFRKHEDRMLFISKISMGCGLALPILVTAGIVKVSLRKYGAYSLVGCAIRTVFMMALGYFFGNLYGPFEITWGGKCLIVTVLVLPPVCYGVLRMVRARLPVVE